VTVPISPNLRYTPSNHPRPTNHHRNTRMRLETLAVAGGGAWGTALAQTQTRAGGPVTLWARNAAAVAEINASHTNAAYLPGATLDARLTATTDLAEAARADIILLAAPAQQSRALAVQLRPLLTPAQAIVICAKGIEQATGHLLGRVLAEELPGIPLAVLSGPGFAADIVRGLPAALTLGCRDEALGRALAARMSHPLFRLYWSADTTGVELGGAVKNVLGIAAGIIDGKQLGGSAHAALVTRGFAELRRLGDALGARGDTLMGLSGLGDLILTCGSAQSRNMSLGRALGQGRSLAEILGSRTAVTEGVYTAAAVNRLAREHAIEMPICHAVGAILDGTTTVDAAIAALLQRPLKAED
jgi:glycerol-3-phosphate dehydrogenase (NAD(P)+)